MAGPLIEFLQEEERLWQPQDPGLAMAPALLLPGHSTHREHINAQHTQST